VSRGLVQPYVLSREYRVRIEYDVGLPRVWIEDPPLMPREEGGRIPHVFPGPRPCLFYPPNREWIPSMLIADTIVPWLMAWLYFYEIWHATGEWLGGGIDHDAPKGADGGHHHG